MAGYDDFRSYTSTPARRHTFYCYCTKELVQDQAIFFLLVEAFRGKRSKRQALFINDWFINGNIPDELQEYGYLTNVNIAADLKNSVSDRAQAAVADVGLTFADKRAKHGGGVRGFFGAVAQKFGDTGVSGDMFNAPQAQVVTMLDENGKHGFGGAGGLGATYMANGKYQPRAMFSGQVQIFGKYLKEAGFKPNELGIY